MRYYSIALVNPTTSQVLVPNPNANGTAFVLSNDKNAVTFTSLNAGASPQTQGGSNPAALRCELDITSTPLHSPDAHAKPFVRISGVPLSMVAQAADLNGMFISISGGMAKGLPLANPQQAGLLAAGQVLQGVGEWVDTDMSLTLYLAPGGASADYSNVSGSASAMQPVTGSTPANLVFQWNAGQSMSTAIANCLVTAFPQLSIKMQISNALVWGSGVPKVAFFENLQQFAQFINEASKSVLAGPNPANTIYAQSANPAYQGVTILLTGGTLVVQDFTTQTNPIAVDFEDLVGQPNQSAPGKVQLMTVMRGDIAMSDFVQLPPSLGTTSAFGTSNGGVSAFVFGNASNSPYKANSAFQGVALVTKVRHVGDSRNAAGKAWVSTYELAFAQPTTSPLLSSIPYIYKSPSGNSYGFTGSTP
ncbi:hypothetical protein [Caballeronia udeis]|nr:hypothetical protein [Caballeronia udeis]